MRIFRTLVLKTLAGTGNQAGAGKPRHDLVVLTPYRFSTISISLMNPTHEATVVVLERGLCLAECSRALLEIERSALTQVHRS